MDDGLRAQELRALLHTYQRAYYTTGRALVSDLEYDRLFDELSAIEKKHPELVTEDSPTKRVGSDLSSDFPEVKHTIPVLSLDKAYSAEEIYSFIDKTVKAGSSKGLSFALEEKIDGFSIVLYYEGGVLKRAVTRGNGTIGNDVTANVKTIHAVPLRLTQDIDIAVRGEIYLPKNEFEHINSSLEEPYANPRNLAAGTIRRICSSDVAKVPLSIFCYEGFWSNSLPFTDHIQIMSELKKLGFKTDPNFSFFCRTKEEAQQRLADAGLDGLAFSFDDIPSEIERRTSQRSSLDYEIDGLVLKVNELATREDLGYTEHHPRWAIAYKFESPQAKSTVQGIDVQVGRTGRITPMARIKPTELSGSVISNVTLHNQDYVNQLEIAVGDTVAISKRGDVIPAVEQVLDKNEDGNTTYKIPEYCPVCNSPIIKEGAHHFCSNLHCPARERGALEFFCAKKQMDIEGLGPATIEVLYSHNYIRTIADIFRFDFEALLRDGVEGYGKKKIQAIQDGVDKARKQDFKKVIVGLGIPELGHKAMDLIEKHLHIENVDQLLELAQDRDNCIATLSSVDGIGNVIATSITDGLRNAENISVINQLKELGVNLSAVKKENNEEQIFAGQTWCVTGTFEHFVPRERAMEEIVKRGGTEVSSVSSKTTCLLAGANAGSKLAKAQALGVKIVSEDQFIQMLGNNTVKEEKQQEDQLSLF